jgi:hypothetical protein
VAAVMAMHRHGLLLGNMQKYLAGQIKLGEILLGTRCTD